MPINEQNSLDSLSNAINTFTKKQELDQLTNTSSSRIIMTKLKMPKSSLYSLKLLLVKSISLSITLLMKGVSTSYSEKVDRFVQFLESKTLIVNLRRSRGKDIDAACGQLANKLAK